jgi:hypothetical protein
MERLNFHILWITLSSSPRISVFKVIPHNFQPFTIPGLLSLFRGGRGGGEEGNLRDHFAVYASICMYVSSLKFWDFSEIALLSVYISLNFFTIFIFFDCLCGLVVRVLGYRSGDPGSIPSTTRKKSSGSGTGSTQLREYNWGAYLIEK